MRTDRINSPRISQRAPLTSREDEEPAMPASLARLPGPAGCEYTHTICTPIVYSNRRRTGMRNWIVRTAGVVVWAALLAGLSRAQTSSTEVVGLVTDASGAPVAGAEVTLTRLDTGETRHASSNADGNYAFPLIEPGSYKVVVSVAGFKTTTISNINVLYQQRARVDVTAEARLLNTEDAAVGQNIESKRVVELPVAYRSVGQLALLVPGVSFGTRMGRATGATGRTSPAGTAVALVAQGQTDQTQGVTLDGVDVKEPRYNTMTLVPSLDAIAEFKIQTAAYSAEYGLS